MKIFVAGATGVLGRRVVKCLIAHSHQVVGLSRSDKNSLQIFQLGAKPRRGDLFNEDSMISISSDCDAILHLATAIPTKIPSNKSDWELNDRIRIEGTKNLIEAARRNNCKLYLQQSITAIYGNRNGDWVDEYSAISPDLPYSVKSSEEMERLVITANNNYGLPAIILRFGTFYSHDSVHTKNTLDMIKRGNYNIIGDGNVYWNLVNLDDAADAVVKAVNTSEINIGRTFNICDDKPTLYKDIVAFIAEKLNADTPGTISIEKAKQLMGSGLVEYLISSYRCSNKKAKQELDWEPNYSNYKEGYSFEIKKWLINKNTNQLV